MNIRNYLSELHKLKHFKVHNSTSNQKTLFKQKETDKSINLIAIVGISSKERQVTSNSKTLLKHRQIDKSINPIAVVRNRDKKRHSNCVDKIVSRKGNVECSINNSANSHEWKGRKTHASINSVEIKQWANPIAVVGQESTSQSVANSENIIPKQVFNSFSATSQEYIIKETKNVGTRNLIYTDNRGLRAVDGHCGNSYEVSRVGKPQLNVSRLRAINGQKWTGTSNSPRAVNGGNTMSSNLKHRTEIDIYKENISGVKASDTDKFFNLHNITEKFTEGASGKVNSLKVDSNLTNVVIDCDKRNGQGIAVDRTSRAGTENVSGLVKRNDVLVVNNSNKHINSGFSYGVHEKIKEIGVIFKNYPEVEITRPKKVLKKNCTADQYKEAVSEISRVGIPNYKGARIEIQSNINLDKWESYLKNYKDKEVVNLLRYGFPLGINDHKTLNRTNISNHSTATQYPTDVQAYINKEKEKGALLGPFTKIPHEEYHSSPLLTRPKEGDTRRVIVDLSYGDVSVNGCTIKISMKEENLN